MTSNYPGGPRADDAETLSLQRESIEIEMDKKPQDNSFLDSDSDDDNLGDASSYSVDDSYSEENDESEEIDEVIDDVVEFTAVADCSKALQCNQLFEPSTGYMHFLDATTSHALHFSSTWV